MIAELLGDGDHVGVLQEHEPAVAVVVGERAERLWPQGDLGMEFERGVEHWVRQAVGQ